MFRIYSGPVSVRSADEAEVVDCFYRDLRSFLLCTPLRQGLGELFMCCPMGYIGVLSVENS